MAFSLNMPGVLRVTSYHEAAEVFAMARTPVDPQRACGYMRIPRYMHRPSSATSMRHRDNGDIVFRYGSQDIVTWHTNNTCSVDGRVRLSRSTAVFMRRFVPMNVDILRLGAVLWTSDGLLYNIAQSEVLLDISGRLASDPKGLRGFTGEARDRAETVRFLRDCGWYDFLKWYRIMWPLARENAHTESDSILLDDEKAFDLRDQDIWPRLLRCRRWALGSRLRRVSPEQISKAFITNYQRGLCSYAERTGMLGRTEKTKMFLSNVSELRVWKPK